MIKAKHIEICGWNSFFLINNTITFGFLNSKSNNYDKIKLFLDAFIFNTQLFADKYFYRENDKIVYLDSTWTETSKDNYKYYRIIIEYNLDKTHYKFYDYFKSGVMYMQGKSESKNELFIAIRKSKIKSA
jgi:hypothetical protein